MNDIERQRARRAADEASPSRAPEGEPRRPKFRRRAAARPDEVLDAALDLFIDKGFVATRVEDIAKRAGISKGAVYLYFPSKEAILEGLVRRAIVPVTENVASMAAGYDGSIREAITIAFAMIAMRLADPRMLAIPRLIMHEVTRFPGLAKMYREEVIDKARPILEALIAKGIARGEFRPVDPDLTVRSIIGPVAIHVLLSEVFGVTRKDGLRLDLLLANHLDILFDGLSVKPAGSDG
ncbi:MAG: TetR/AcrR family transcriptional regulator [Cucumibacter sp.]